MGKKTLTVDGNTAAAYVAYAYTEVAAIYPITPSSTMAEVVDEWAANGQKNIFGQTVNVVEMQSEAGAAGTFHGSLQAGALTTTFTASQGLLLMIPDMYKVAGELLPGVFHVSARALAAQALSIFGDHQDVMAARQIGCVMLASSSVQEVADIAPVAHLAALKGRLPFIHFFDGFRTSHEIQKIEVLDYEDYANLLDQNAFNEFRKHALSPSNPVTRGTAQNPDIYFQTKEASSPFYEKIAGIVEEYFDKINTLTGRKYGLFNYYGAKDAQYIIIAIGSVCEAIEETIDYCNSQGKKYGLVKVHLYRPFSMEHFLKCIPDTVKKVAVLDRTKEPGSVGEPLYLDVVNSFFQMGKHPDIIGGRYGLGSKDTTPSDIKAIFENLESQNAKNRFTIGINDDVMHTSLEVKERIVTEDPNTVRCIFWGLGSDGTVGANKQAIKIIGDNTDKYVQAYFAYDSKKSGGLTKSYLRFGDTPIRATYLIEEADYIACHNPSYVHTYDLTKGLKEGGTFVLNCRYNKEELDSHIPARLKRALAKKKAEFYIVDAIQIAEDIGLRNRISMVMQGVFFKLNGILPEDKAKDLLKKSVEKMFRKKGEQIIEMNCKALEEGFAKVIPVDIPADWENAEDSQKPHVEEPEFIKNILRPMERQEGELLPVSAFNGMEDGTFPNGTAAYEKRGVAVNVPEWIIENCIQCNQCSYICPHATIRPFLLTEEEQKKAPASFETKKTIEKKLGNFGYRIQLDPMDCTGCGNCADICPAKPKALVMKKLATQTEKEVPNWEYAIGKVSRKDDLFAGNTVKDTQFKMPYHEFSGACAGCGETPYIKLVTQLFGDRMMIANATGCSSIWGASAPSTPYTADENGKGPSWANSLFEDNAEYGLGMRLGIKQIRDQIAISMEHLINRTSDETLKQACEKWLESKEEGEASKKAAKAIEQALASYSPENPEEQQWIMHIARHSKYLVKPSQWILGGDGWAYDIDYGGLDHVLASGEDLNVLVFDTEIYSNTGGQASKSTPAAAIAKFATSGKRTRKKDLGRMMITYGNVYVAQVSMGADKNHVLKVIREAEAYKGPSLIIAYAPCINHGIKEGMGRSIANMAQAVACGYWHLWRYNPELKAEGKNPFTLDSKPPKDSFRDFIMGQVRYTALMKQSPEKAEELYEYTEQMAKERYEEYLRLAGKE
ncbi:pyruvate:ferredoxin (flavodoxin) oxidoreductase [[Clostridium] polysaccharolyticum]|uniref:Pyruvate:ferredoxin oxidoreductase n=1 Tax=[Clostridium] polysaccharolyticum TaxID=29364 RepID=A0A1I0CJZ2_9FIRM|nr:pyruvate:ferredoxin (flavodoxin) oxidoreductase [[Clostridium] polysaccharolyticum]SET19877.1 pyruvate-ferredoxin/flavodoxin oxidoreductase [[Clostridium] polysaccharolyticum]